MLKFDESGYDSNGFNIKGIHKDTKTRYDKDGYDHQGYDEFGLNKYGFTRDGHYAQLGDNGKLTVVFAKITTRMLSKENDKNYNKDGYTARGFSGVGKNYYVLKKNPELGDIYETFDRRGFLADGTNIETGTKYNKYGYDAYGYNKDGFDEYGFNAEGINEYTGTKLDLDGNSYKDARAYKRRKLELPEGLDKDGFDENGLWNRTSRFSKETGLDIEGYDKNGFNIDGINRAGFRKDGIHIETNIKYGPDGYDIDGYDIDGYDKDGYDMLGIDRNGINKETNIKDERIEFGEKFIKSEQTIEAFAKENGLELKKVKKDLDELKKSPYISQKLTETLTKNETKSYSRICSIRDEILTGKIDIKQVINIDVILKVCSNEEDKAKIMNMLVKSASKHDISIMEYRSILGLTESGRELPKRIADKIDELKTYARKSKNKEITGNISELYKERDRINGYKAPFREEDLKSVGYIKPGEKEPTTLNITKEHIEIAKEYLYATGDFVCYKTMSMAFMKIAKGELNRETLDEIKKQKEEHNLPNSDEEKHKLVKEILEKQRHISEQNAQINELKNQRGLTNE